MTNGENRFEDKRYSRAVITNGENRHAHSDPPSLTLVILVFFVIRPVDK